MRPEASVAPYAVRAASESLSEVQWGQSNHEMKRQDSPFCSLIPQCCCVLSLCRYEAGERTPPRQISLCAARTGVLLHRSISAGLNMNKIHLRTFEAIRERQGSLFKAFPCVKAVFFLICCSLILKCQLLCIFTDSLTHWQSLKLFLNQHREIQHTHKNEKTLFLRFSGELYLSKYNFLPEVLNYGSPNLHLLT